jgi:hypothetical protein
MADTDARTTLTTNEAAQALLRSARVARLGYTWTDGTPRVVPMWFHWTGEELVMGAPPNSPKMRVLRERPAVAVSIDNDQWPYQVLSLRGSASAEVVDGIFPEYADMARRYLGEEGGAQFLDLARQTFTRWTRVTIRPAAARVLDFGVGQFPSAWSAGAAARA